MLNNIFEAISDLKKGKMLIVVDDENRENEGDFIIPAQCATPEAINFMATHGKGLICAPITAKKAQSLELPYMVSNNQDKLKTAFTISVDATAEHGTTTGISAFDRAKTIELLASPKSVATDFSRPGHIFPLIAQDGGVLERAGHTEAAIDLALLAGFEPAGVICEILSHDGTCARLPELQMISKQTGIKIITIEDIISFKKHLSCFDKKDHYEQYLER